MKGKRYTTEEKIRIQRQANKVKTTLEASTKNNNSEQTFIKQITILLGNYPLTLGKSLMLLFFYSL